MPITVKPGALQRIIGRFATYTGGLWTRYNGMGWSRIRWFLPSARFDWEREAGDVWMNSIVGLAISWLGDRFPRPIVRVARIGRSGDFIPLPRHDAVDIWQQPNPYYGRRTLEKAIGLSLKCDGNAYIYKVRDRGGNVCQLWWIPHFRVMPTWPEDGSKYVDGYKVRLDSLVVDLPVEDVIHIRDGIDPWNERLGLAALRACLREVVTVNYESSYTAGILKNGGVPGVIIAPDPATNGQLRPSKDDAERIKERFNDEFGTANDQAGGAMVMAGAYKVTVLGFSPEAMRLDRLPLNAISRISASLGVTTMSLGLPDPGKTYSNLAEANRASWGSIIAVQELVAEALRYQYLPEFGLDPKKNVWEYDYTQIQELQESLDAVHTRTRDDFTANIIRQNEAREILGYEPDPDGDVYAYELTAAPAEPEEPEGVPGVFDDPVKRFSLNGDGAH
jgi:HK97 family phage portal protein